jgi:AcrR family transcriptional regulator
VTTEERRQREREQRRTDIIDAAERIFFSKGYDQATMDDIAERSELSKGTLYLYFESKRDIYHAIVRRGLIILRDRFANAMGKRERGIEKIMAIGEAYIKFYHEHPLYLEAMLDYEASESDSFSDGNPLELVVEALRTGIDDGSIRVELDPIKTAIVLWGQTTGIMQTSYRKCKAFESAYDVSMDEIVSYYFKLAYRMLSTLNGDDRENPGE